MGQNDHLIKQAVDKALTNSQVAVGLVPIQPVMTRLEMQIAETVEGMKFLILKFSTPQGENVFFLDKDYVNDTFMKALSEAVLRLNSSLVVP